MSRAAGTASAFAAWLVIAALPAPAAADVRPRPPEITSLESIRELPGTEALRMRSPAGLAIDHRGYLVIADSGNHRVLVVTTEGELVDALGGYGWDPGQFDTPTDLAVYQGFYTYVLEEGNRRVSRFDVRGDFLDYLVPEDEAGSPVSIAVGPAGRLFLVDRDSQSVLSYSQFNEVLEPVGRFGLDAGGLVDPRQVAVGPSREIAVTDPGTYSVKVFDEFGAPLFSLSTPDTLLPDDVAFDSKGNVIVADASRGRVLAFPAGGGRPSASFTWDDGFRPGALCVGPLGTVAALDVGTGRVLLIEAVYAADAATRP